MTKEQEKKFTKLIQPLVEEIVKKQTLNEGSGEAAIKKARSLKTKVFMDLHALLDQMTEIFQNGGILDKEENEQFDSFVDLEDDINILEDKFDKEMDDAIAFWKKGKPKNKK